MFSKVRVCKGALNYFRKLARQTAPLEIQAYLAGKVISINEVEITDFLYTKNYYKQTNNEVSWSTKEYDKVKLTVEDSGLRIIGEIHSHPGWDAVMSPADFSASVTQQLVICGICSINDKNRTRVRFWTPTSALPCTIVYT
jgi:proteasome lid subunit RPN8/RPN11